jgi:hypothetical protein
MRRAWRDQIAVWIALGSGGVGGSTRSGAFVTGLGAVVVAASIALFDGG